MSSLFGSDKDKSADKAEVGYDQLGAALRGTAAKGEAHDPLGSSLRGTGADDPGHKAHSKRSVFH
jgi:hypothetical protein